MRDRSPRRRGEPTLPKGVTIERESPDDVFALLSDDIRVGILQGLAETPDEAVSFGDLRARVGIRDSGQFNYHLRKLRGSFVRKTDEGYELTYAGRQIIGAMYAGTYTTNATVDPLPTEGSCPVCEGGVVLEYANETATVTCSECDEWRNEFAFPPGSLDQFSREELPTAVDRWMFHILDGILAGFCHVCAGRVEGRLVRDDDDEQLLAMPAHAEFECTRCGATARASGAMPVVFHPAVQGFLYDHGFDLRASPSWTFEPLSLPSATLHSEEPLELSVCFDYGDDSITAIVGADTRVRAVERERRST